MVVILLLVPSSSSASLTTPTCTVAVSSSPTRCQLTTTASSTPTRATTYHYAHQSKFPDANRNYSREFVNHVTRINISNDFPQAEGGSGEPEAVVKEGEYTTRQGRERHVQLGRLK